MASAWASICIRLLFLAELPFLAPFCMERITAKPGGQSQKVLGKYNVVCFSAKKPSVEVSGPTQMKVTIIEWINKSTPVLPPLRQILRVSHTIDKIGKTLFFQCLPIV